MASSICPKVRSINHLHDLHCLRKFIRETICKNELSLIRFWPSQIRSKLFLFWRKDLKLRTVITKIQKSRARLTLTCPRSSFRVELLFVYTSSELLFEYHIRLLDIHQRMELALFHDEIAPIPIYDGCQAIKYDEIFSYRPEPCHSVFFIYILR